MAKVRSPSPSRRKIRTTLPKSEVHKLLTDLPAILSGEKNSRFGLHRLYWGAVAYALFTSIYEAYEIKAYGLPDELGNQWSDLTKKYKAYRRPLLAGAVSKVEDKYRRRLKANETSGGLGLLTPGQHKKWKQDFGKVYHSAKKRMEDGEAKAFAGQVAWTKAKASGAKTMLEVLGNRDLLILRVSDTLFRSLTPGKFDPKVGYKKGDRYQVFTIKKGAVDIGTSVFYGNMVSQRGGQELRPIWPENMDPWISDAIDFAMDVVMDKIESILR